MTGQEAFDEIEAVRAPIQKAVAVLRVVDVLSAELPGMLHLAESEPFELCVICKRLGVLDGLVSLFAPAGSTCDVAATRERIAELRQALTRAYEASQADGAPKMDLATALEHVQKPTAEVGAELVGAGV